MKVRRVPVAAYGASAPDHALAAWAATEGGVEIGHVFLCSTYSAYTAQVDSLHVSPEHRSRGVATALMRACVRWARAQPYDTLTLRVQRYGSRHRQLSVAQLRAFYTKLSFAPLGEGSDKTLMYRYL